MVVALALAACGGGGGGGGVEEAEPAGGVSTTRLRVDNRAVCAQLRAIRAVDRETARLAAEVARAVVAGSADAVLAAGEALAAHLAASAEEVDAAYAASVEEAPATVVDALDQRARSRTEVVGRLGEILGGATSGEEISQLFEAIGAAAGDAAAEQDTDSTRALSRYTEVICGFSMTD